MAGGYNIYRGIDRVENIDYETPVAIAPAGSASASIAGLGHLAGRSYFYAVRAVSDAGVEEENTDRVVEVRFDDDGELAGDVPSAIQEAYAVASADGEVLFRAYYDRAGEAGVAATVEICRVIDGVPQWASVLDSVTLTAGNGWAEGTAGTFADKSVVILAARAVTAEGVAGPTIVMAPVVADGSAPEQVAGLAGVQA